MAKNETKSKLAMARDIAICGIGLAVIPVGWILVGGAAAIGYHLCKKNKNNKEKTNEENE